MSADGDSQNWMAADLNSHRWDPAESSALMPPMDNSRKESGRKRMESVFAQSSYAPQQMLPGNASMPGSHLHQGHLPSAYQSLPSEISAQMAFPTGGHSLQSSGSMYPSIDHTESIANQFGVLNRDIGSQAFQSGASNGFTIQCGRFTAPVQRAPVDMPGSSFPLLSGHTIVAQADKERNLDPKSAYTNPAQLQEYYSAQSDMLEDLMRNNRAMQQHINNTNSLVGQADLDAELADIFGYISSQAPMQRANSALDALPQPQPQSHYPPLEPYMPQWSSESVPAELPNHVVNRLLMRGPTSSRTAGSLSGTKRRNGLLSKPSPSYLDHKISKGRQSAPGSPDVTELEEIARTADAEVAHRAFLVPAHKKRGKGGRQPAADPRLDPSIDERKAKRILANRLSAARSKMKQKNQTEVMGKMVSDLEQYKKGLQDDAAELMELCEKLELQNRKMSKDQQILEEYLARADRSNPHLAHGMAQRLNTPTESFMPFH